MELEPQMQPKEIAAIKRILSSYAPHVNILEWGSGGSTVYFTNFLHSKGILYTWMSMEYNKLWYERISDLVKNDKNVTLILFDVCNTSNKQPDIPMDEYVVYPASLGKKYDFILVDGRKRRQCLLEAVKLLNPRGCVLLHDARRSYYHCVFSSYLDSRMLLWSGLWQGKLENPGPARRATNLIGYWCSRVSVFLLRFLQI